MKKHISILFSLFMLSLACSEETVVDGVLDGFTRGAALRILSSSTDLDIADLNSEMSAELQAQDDEDGRLLQSVEVSVGFDDNTNPIIDGDTIDISKAPTVFRTIPASEFTEMVDGLPVTTFTANYGDLLNHLGFTTADVNISDEIEISLKLLLIDERSFTASNSGNNVTSTGGFAFFRSPFRLNAELKDIQRLAIDEFELTTEDGRFKEGDTDVVFVEFDRSEFSVTQPTVSIVNSGSATGGMVSALTQVSGDRYSFTYTAGQGDGMVSFVVSGGEAVSGFVMVNDTLSNAYTVDNTNPTPVASRVNTAVTGDNKFDEISILFDFGERLQGGDIEYIIVPADPMIFDADTVQNMVTDGVLATEMSFTPLKDNMPVDQQNIMFDVAVKKVKDVPGNVGDANVTISLF